MNQTGDYDSIVVLTDLLFRQLQRKVKRLNRRSVYVFLYIAIRRPSQGLSSPISRLQPLSPWIHVLSADASMRLVSPKPNPAADCADITPLDSTSFGRKHLPGMASSAGAPPPVLHDQHFLPTIGSISGENNFRLHKSVPLLSEHSRLLIVLGSSADVFPIGPKNITRRRYFHRIAPHCSFDRVYTDLRACSRRIYDGDGFNP